MKKLLYISLQPGKTMRSAKDISEKFVMDLDVSGNVLGIEVLDYDWLAADGKLTMAQDVKVGDLVRKPRGYGFPGIVVAAFYNTQGEERYVVEARGEGYEGMLHIFNGEQIQKI